MVFWSFPVTETHPEAYSRLSIALHWFAAIVIIALFFTHEGERGSAAYSFHVGVGALTGLFILWRAIRRPYRGFPPKPDQSALLNLLSQIVMWGFVVAMILVFVTGYLLPWSLGRPIDIFGIISIPSPLPQLRWLHEAAEEIHEISGQAFVPLVILHVAGAAKHAFIDRDGIQLRMVRPKTGGY